jgi:hypothetical protein
MIEELKNKTIQIQSSFNPMLERIIKTNPVVLFLIDKLQLEEV